MTLLFSEGYEDTSFASRGWYDITTGTVDSTTFAPAGGSTASLRVDWTSGSTTPVVPTRHLFTATDQVYCSIWFKFGSASVTWQGSGLTFHPHWILVMTDSDGAFVAPAGTNLTFYIETNLFTPRAAIQDATRIDTTPPYPQHIYPGLLGTASPHAVAGGNGDQTQSSPSFVDFFNSGGWSNDTHWDSASANFINNTWHHVEWFVKMNSISGGLPQADGIIKYWVDGNLCIDHTNVYLRTAQFANQKFNQFMFGPYIGSGSPITQSAWIDNLEIHNSLPLNLIPSSSTVVPFRPQTIWTYRK